MKINLKPEIKIIECINKKDRFKTLKFNLEKLNTALYIPNKSIANTYFFCQKVDICFIDKENIIIALYENVKSEKIIWKKKAHAIYFLPLNTAKKLQIGKKIPIKE